MGGGLVAKEFPVVALYRGPIGGAPELKPVCAVTGGVPPYVPDAIAGLEGDGEDGWPATGDVPNPVLGYLG